ncbi:MAG: arginase [Crocinitomicaceae bacterium]|nr:arginase [Crocinitomicaceae bacterium]
MKKNITLLINKSEITAGTRGASLGPEAVITAARKQNNLFFGKFPIDHVSDENHMLDAEVKYPHAKRIEGLVKVFDSVSSKVKGVIDDGGFPLVIAGDHGSAGGTIAGVKAAYPTKRLGVVWIDAHGDLHTPYTTPSGNMHGMPLATALSEDNTEVQSNTPASDVVELWGTLKSMKVADPKVQAEDLAFIAVRDTEPQEDALIERLKIKNHTVDEVREKGVEAVMAEIFDQLKECDIIYVSFDVDSMDPEFTSYGTGTPVEHGLKPEEAEYFLVELAKHEKTVCMEFVEVNPCLDEKKNKMAEVTFDLLEKTTNELLNS